MSKLTQKAPIWTKAFSSLFLTNLAIFTVFYGFIATLPLFAKGVLSRTDEEAGLLLSVFLLSAIFVRPFSGKLLDRFGKRKMLWISISLYILSTFLYYFMPTFEAMLVLRFIHGVWFSIVSTATGAIAADIVPIKRRGTGLGYFAMSTNLAVVIGPFIGLLLVQHYSYNMLFIVMSVMVVAGGLLSLLTPADAIKVQSSLRFTWSDLFERKALPVAMIGGVISFSHAGILSYLSIYAEQKQLFAFASFFFVVFAAVMLITRPFTGRIFDTYGPFAIILPGFICFIIGFLLLAFMQSGWVFMLAAAFVGLGFGALVPSLQAMAINSTSPERSSYATATFFTLFDFGIAIGSYILGMIAVHFTYPFMYITASMLILFVFIFVLVKRKKIIVQ